MSKTEEEDGLAFEIKTKLEELRDAAVAKIEEERAEIELPDGEEWPEIDRDGLKIRIPDDIVYNLLKIRLNENDCRNRGYILDGFPRSYKDC
jgi:adenylate kinase family enzyme